MKMEMVLFSVPNILLSTRPVKSEGQIASGVSAPTVPGSLVLITIAMRLACTQTNCEIKKEIIKENMAKASRELPLISVFFSPHPVFLSSLVTLRG